MADITGITDISSIPVQSPVQSPIISKFTQIEITKKKPLIICDIDGTLLRFDKEYLFFYQKVLADCIKFPFVGTKEEQEKYMIEDARCMYNIYIHMDIPIHTDAEGFSCMEQKIKELGGKLLFLTARTKENSLKYTIKNFKDIGLDYNNYIVHYTDNIISKGDYIANRLNIKDYGEIIFIDDYPEYIKTVKDRIPEIICYQFQAEEKERV